MTSFPFIDIWKRAMRLEPQTLVSDWADAKRILPNTSAEPGHWKTSRTPYLKDIMNCLSVASPYERVVFMKAAQIGATEAALNFAGHIIENAPGVLLYVSPTDAASQRNVRLRVDPLIDTTPELAALVTRRRSRTAGNNNALKTFPGGQLSFVGANSAVGLRSTPARYIVADEIDAFPADCDGEGDPISLAIQRTVTFAGRRKIFLLSTPTLEGVSRIAKAFDEGDQRQYHVPCPHCGTLQVLKWTKVRWPDEDRSKAFYLCEHCGSGISERHKQNMVSEGVWMPMAEGDGKTASFHISALYSPFVSWSEIALEHEACGNDPTRLQTWTNCSLGETWEDKQATHITADQLLTRASGWGETLPDEVVRITGSADVQMDRLEVEIVGWGKGEQSWSIAYISLPGNPAEQEIWTRLDNIRKQRFPHRKLGTLSISAFCVDSGNWSKSVYAYTGRRFDQKVFAVKGSSDPTAPIWPRRPSRPKDGRESNLYIVGSTAAKEIVMSRLGIPTPGPGFCNFPPRDFDYFTQLLAEKPIRRFVRGVATRVWVKSGPNEALDARIYCLCGLHALKSYGVDLDREAERVARMDIIDPDKPRPPKAKMSDFGKLT
jgi:phage terminase large subunit GpA-like protein